MMINKEDFKKKVLEEEDFIKCPRSGNSLQKFLAKSVEEVENKTIAKLLLIEPEEVQKIYDEAVQLIKEDLGEDDED
jgi:hypothetical protein